MLLSLLGSCPKYTSTCTILKNKQERELIPTILIKFMGIVTTLLQNVGHGWLILGLGGGFSGNASDIFIMKF